jgi:hypothetical protein
MDVLGDLVARDRRTDEPLVRFDEGPSGYYTAHTFCTDAWKTASLFRYNGVSADRTVAIADDPSPPALLSLFGAALLGATVRFDPPAGTDARLVVVPAGTVEQWDLPPGSKAVAYGGESDDPTVVGFERGIWSENPTMPPDEVATDAEVLATADATYTHADLLSATDRVVRDEGLTDGDSVAVRAPLSDPGTVVAGVLAPLFVGGEVRLGADAPGTVTVGDGSGPEPRHVDPTTVRP